MRVPVMRGVECVYGEGTVAGVALGSWPRSGAPPGHRHPTVGVGQMEQYGPELRVFVVDDQQVVRRGVRELVNAAGGLVVVGEASTRTSPGWIWSRRSAR